MRPITRVIQSSDVLDGYKAAKFLKEIEAVMETGVRTIVIDLKNLTCMSSSGLMILVSAFKIIKAASGRVFICSMNAQIRMLFELTGVDQVFETLTSLEEFHCATKPIIKIPAGVKPISPVVSKPSSMSASKVLV